MNRKLLPLCAVGYLWIFCLTSIVDKAETAPDVCLYMLRLILKTKIKNFGDVCFHLAGVGFVFVSVCFLGVGFHHVGVGFPLCGRRFPPCWRLRSILTFKGPCRAFIIIIIINNCDLISLFRFRKMSGNRYTRARPTRSSSTDLYPRNYRKVVQHNFCIEPYNVPMQRTPRGSKLSYGTCGVIDVYCTV